MRMPILSRRQSRVSNDDKIVIFSLIISPRDALLLRRTLAADSEIDLFRATPITRHGEFMIRFDVVLPQHCLAATMHRVMSTLNSAEFGPTLPLLPATKTVAIKTAGEKATR